MNGRYLPTIGIECHVQLKTKTKLFAAVGNDARDASPNTLVSHICLGMPGALPVLNEAAIKLAIKAAVALGTEPEKFSSFDRKHYFYPDLPKGYQISQFNHPIISGGYVNITVNGESKRIGITRAHLEEDAGKSTHPSGKKYSLVDLNRAGTPLLEIVSEPQIHSAVEAKAFAKELYLLMRYSDVSDADLYYGNMRFDVNVSVSSDDAKLGTRTETKNLNSFRAVEKSVDYEIERQIKLLESGEPVRQETRGWDETAQKTIPQRSKEEAHDYRYFPDPDIPPIVIETKDVEAAINEIEMMPADVRKELKSLNLDESTSETIVDELYAAKSFMQCRQMSTDDKIVRRIANWLAGEIQAYAGTLSEGWGRLNLDPNNLIMLSELTQASKVSSTGAKQVLIEMLDSGNPPDQIAKHFDVYQVSDENELDALVQKIIDENPRAAGDVRMGENKAIGYLVGQIMKASKGKANPAIAQDLIRKKLQG